jgi:hypothetical protein
MQGPVQDACYSTAEAPADFDELNGCKSQMYDVQQNYVELITINDTERCGWLCARWSVYHDNPSPVP